MERILYRFLYIRVKTPMVDEKKMDFMSLEEWVNELIEGFPTITIEGICETMENNVFWSKLEEFQRDSNEEGARDWLAKFEGYDTYGEMDAEKANDYAYEKAMAEAD